MEPIVHEPERDPQLAALLREAAGEVPEIDWERLRGEIVAGAELPLARMRKTPRRWPPAFRSLVPLAAAAGIAGAALALGAHTPRAPDTRPVTDQDRAQVEQILNESMPDLQAVTGEAANEQLLNAAIGS